MTTNESKEIAEILHLIYCKKAHEQSMEMLNKTDKCQFYLEQSMENCWIEEDHKEWLSQANFFTYLCGPLDSKEVIRNVIDIWKVVKRLKEVNKRLISYIEMIIED